MRFFKKGNYELLSTFLVENDSEKEIQEILLLYPVTMPSNSGAYESTIDTFKHYTDFREEWDMIEPSIEVMEYEKYFPLDSNFDANDSKLKGYKYRTLHIEGKKYEGFIGFKPIFDRDEELTDVLKHFGKNGYTLLNMRLHSALPLKKGIPQWFRVKLKVDYNEGGILYEQIKGAIHPIPYDYVFFHPNSIKKTFLDEIKRLENDQSHKKLIDALSWKAGYLIAGRCNTVYSKFIFYAKFEDVDIRAPIACSNPMSNVLNVASDKPCKKLVLDSLPNENITISVHTTGKLVTLSDILKLIRVFKFW